MAGETPALLYRPAFLCLRSFIKMRPRETARNSVFGGMSANGLARTDWVDHKEAV
jgi:hypothetical protein